MAILSRRLSSLVYRVARLLFKFLPLSSGMKQRFRNRFRGVVLAGSKIAAWQIAPVHRRSRVVRAAGRAVGYVSYSEEKLPDPLPATIVAFYLPQFHSIPENDKWWGEGFTEWTNVTRALPQFEGHIQPRLPGALGFYDLSDPSKMRAQAKLAQSYGIGAFCSYFYWFSGKTLLETPLRNWLADPSIEIPLCLCWANEPWTRTWDGRDKEVLLAQQHTPEDDIAFIAYIAKYLRDPRYLRIEGRPLLLVYRPGLLPDPSKTAARWRNWCRTEGIGEIHLAYVQSFERPHPSSIGFDAAVDFPPNLVAIRPVTDMELFINAGYRGEVLDWREMAKQFVSENSQNYTRYPTVNPGWDNEARRGGRGRSFVHSSPRRFGEWLHHVISAIPDIAPPSRRLVFVNAWNEWAEGAVLEPDTRLGYAFLSSVRAALVSTSKSCSGSIPQKPCAVIHVWHIEVLGELVAAFLGPIKMQLRLVITTTDALKPSVQSLLDSMDVSAEIHTFENRGRDILPFLHVCDLLLNQGVEIVLKLHSKRSPHISNGDDWRRKLLHALTGSDRIDKAVSQFRDDPRLGIIAPSGHVLKLADFIGANSDTLGYLLRRSGIYGHIDQRTEFISGSMFWVRLQALRPLLDAHLDVDEFDHEQGQHDGTMAHAIERAFLIAALAQGFTIATVGDEEIDSASTYAYAQSD